MRTLVFAALIAVSWPAWSVDSQGNFLPIGLGSAKCSVMNANVKGHPSTSQFAYTAFMDGFSTAINLAVDGKINFLQGIDKQSRYQFLRQYCEANPANDVLSGIYALYHKTTGVHLRDQIESMKKKTR